MSRVFTKGTPLHELEVMMTTIPGFDKRGSGLYIYKRMKDPEAGKCNYCLDFKRKSGCTHNKCPYLFERTALGTLDYKTFMAEEHKEIVHDSNFKSRLYQMINNFDGNMFLSVEHGCRYYQVYHELKTKVYSVKSYILGAIYLLTTSEYLWSKVKTYVTPHKIEFEKVKLKGVDIDEYAIYQMARSLYDSVPRVKLSELADEELIENKVFKAMVNGMLVQRYGAEVLTLFMGGKNV